MINITKEPWKWFISHKFTPHFIRILILSEDTLIFKLISLRSHNSISTVVSQLITFSFNNILFYKNPTKKFIPFNNIIKITLKPTYRHFNFTFSILHSHHFIGVSLHLHLCLHFHIFLTELRTFTTSLTRALWFCLLPQGPHWFGRPIRHGGRVKRHTRIWSFWSGTRHTWWWRCAFTGWNRSFVLEIKKKFYRII